MAFESLTERLQGVFKNLRRKGKLSEKEVQEVTKEQNFPYGLSGGI